MKREDGVELKSECARRREQERETETEAYRERDRQTDRQTDTDFYLVRRSQGTLLHLLAFTDIDCPSFASRVSQSPIAWEERRGGGGWRGGGGGRVNRKENEEREGQS